MICPICGFGISKRIEGLCTNCTYDTLEKVFHNEWQAKNIIHGILLEKKTTSRDLAGVVEKISKENINRINRSGIEVQLQYLIDTIGIVAAYEVLFSKI
jgi:hypothetical protein